MEVSKFEGFIREARREFGKILKSYSNKNRNDRTDLKRVLKGYLDKCCSSFEEETLKENLQEEFANYLSTIQP